MKKTSAAGKTTCAFTGKIQLLPDPLADPLPDHIPKMYFVNSMSDLFHTASSRQTYGENMLNLMLARGYFKKLLENAKVVRFLNGNYRDFLTEFEAITAG